MNWWVTSIVTSHPRSAETCLGPGHSPASFLLSLFDKFDKGILDGLVGFCGMLDFCEPLSHETGTW